MMTLIDSLPKVKGSYRALSNLAKTNWFGVGGPAEVMFRPQDANDLSYFLQAKPESIDVTVIGVGSNLIIRDGGIDGVVIRLGRGFTEIERIGVEIHVGAGCLDYNLAMFCLSNNIGGLEFFSGIPGCVGGALAMNAGAYGSDTASILIGAEAVDEKGQLHQLSPADFGFIYRGNTLPDGMIFTKAIFKGYHEQSEIIDAKISEISNKRESTQPVRTRTTGSTFANPTGMKAWELIDKAGCRGLAIGDAVMSEKHCNFMINKGNATAKELENLGEEVRRRVKQTSGIELEWEVKRIGKY
jgi:UDP-N-acetylmuramate dehydrogenase